MKPPPFLIESQSSLRQRAEAAVTASRTDVSAMSLEEIQRLAHELQVHQIELHMQNEELLRTQSELAFSRDRFSDLYDFAPVGYVTLDSAAVVVEANLTLAKLLGVERKDLVARKFTRVVAPDSQDALYLHLLALADDPEKKSCDLNLFGVDGEILDMRMESIALRDAHSGVRRFLCALIDVTERNRAERALLETNAELKARNEELERFNRAGVGRELRMIELKKEVNELCDSTDQTRRYPGKRNEEPPR